MACMALLFLLAWRLLEAIEIFTINEDTKGA
jgi:hypothetical protein